MTPDSALTITSYDEFKNLLKDSECRKCPLALKRTNIVVDRGNPEAKVVMIGEAPGENEDLTGKAFVGRSGNLLDGMLRELGFDTNKDSLIINVAKCRPPDNRRPTDDEALACRPYLEKQLYLVRPKIILLLGATALKHMVGNKTKSSMAGTVGNFFTHPGFPGIQLMVIYHPAYILRDPRKKPRMMEHLKTFVSEWKKQ